MPFNLERATAKLSSLNVRAEVHGTDKTPAADLRFVLNSASGKLEEFAPGFRTLIFHKAGYSPNLADQGSELPDLRFPRLAPLAWEGDIIGAEVVIHFGTGGKSDIVLPDCKVNKFGIDPQQGGTVIITFRCQAHPDGPQIAKLYGLIQRDVEVSLEGPDFSEPDADEDEDK